MKPLKDNGVASVVVENAELAGRQAVLVLLTGQGELVVEARIVPANAHHRLIVLLREIRPFLSKNIPICHASV